MERLLVSSYARVIGFGSPCI